MLQNSSICQKMHQYVIECQVVVSFIFLILIWFCNFNWIWYGLIWYFIAISYHHLQFTWLTTRCCHEASTIARDLWSLAAEHFLCVLTQCVPTQHYHQIRSDKCIIFWKLRKHIMNLIEIDSSSVLYVVGCCLRFKQDVARRFYLQYGKVTAMAGVSGTQVRISYFSMVQSC